jgi:simple sugar transport system ATP-binding protein
MVGRDLASHGRRRDSPQGEVVLSVSRLSRAHYYRNVSFELRAGEILGLTGQLDSGRTALALTLYGMLAPASGEIRVAGRSVSLDTVAEALASEIAMAPEDRLTEGLFLPRSVGTNLASGALAALSNAFGFIDWDRTSAFENDWIDRLSIVTPGPDAPARSLSGGNQQRVVLGRVLSRRPRIVVLNGPTVGVDVGSKDEIHGIIEDMSGEGTGVLLVSDDADELVRLCGRVLVMSRGEIVREIDGREFRRFRGSELLRQD